MRARRRLAPWLDNVRATARLASPVVLARVGLLVLTTTDIIMTGRYSTSDLAYLALANSVQLTMLLVGLGFLFGVVVLTAQAAGAEEWPVCGAIWRVGLTMGLVLGVALSLVCLAGEPLLRGLGQTEALARGGGSVLEMFAIGLPGQILFFTTSMFLEGLRRPTPAMYVMIGAVVLNFFLNSLLIAGGSGFPAMGARGAVLATALVNWAMAVSLFIYALFMPGHGRYQLRTKIVAFGGIFRKMLRLGAPFSLQQGLEASAFTALVQMAGYIGATALAAYQIAISLNALLFMIAVGTATATSVRVAMAVSSRDRAGIVMAGWSGVGLVLVVMSVMAVLLWTFPSEIASIYTTDPAVHALTARAIVIVGGLLIVDAFLIVLISALRGAGDIWAPTAIIAVCFWGIAIPAAVGLAFYGSLGPLGLLEGLSVGLLVAGILAAWRFNVISHRDIRRI